MENIHIKLEYGEALYAKKELLSMQLNLLEFQKKFKDYKNSRKRELILKGKLRKELSSLKQEIDNMEEALPKEEGEGLKLLKRRTRKKYKRTEKKGQRGIERELQEIKEKLAALG